MWVVHYRSDDGWFDGSIEKVWKHNESHTDDNIPKLHKAYVKVRTIETKGNAVVQEFTRRDERGGTYVERVRTTMYPPTGYAMEWLSGPMAGSFAMNVYVAEGPKRTRVVLDGDFRIEGMDDNSVRKIVDAALNEVYEEDRRHIR